MEKRYLIDLSEDELKKVLEVNDDLYDELVDYYRKDEDFWVNEAMNILAMDGVVLGYRIDCNGGFSYIDFDEKKPFTSLGNIDNYRHTFGGNHEIDETLNDALKVLKIYDECNNLFGRDVDDFIRAEAFENEINDYVDGLSKMIADYFKKGYDYDDDIILEALYRKYIEDDPNRLYVKDDSYIAYETMEIRYG